jgi:hypothetical protein
MSCSYHKSKPAIRIWAVVANLLLVRSAVSTPRKANKATWKFIPDRSAQLGLRLPDKFPMKEFIEHI